MSGQTTNKANLTGKREITCPFCDKAGEKVLFTSLSKIEIDSKESVFTIARCKNCRLIYVTNPCSIPETFELNSQREEKTGLFKKMLRKKWDTIRSSFVSSEITAVNLLQIECGKGLLLARLKEQGHNVLGIDVNNQLIRTQDKAVNETYAFDFLNFFHYDNEFDAILFIDSLRYSPDPEKEIDKAIRLLHEDGAIFVEERIFNSRISNGFNENYSEYDFPASVYFFNPYTLKKLFRDKGFRLKSRVKYFPGGYFDFLKSFSFFLKNKWKLKNILFQLPLLIPAFVLSPIINTFLFGSNFIRYGVFGNRFLGVFVHSKNR